MNGSRTTRDDQLSLGSSARTGRTILVALTIVLAAGCSILPETEPVRLVDPRIEGEPGRHGDRLPWTLNITRPETDPVRDSNRVLVRTSQGQLQVHPRARWVAPAPELVRTAVVRYLRDSEMLEEVGASAAGSDRTLVIDLRRFELARSNSGVLQVSLRADALVYSSASAERIGRRRFDHEAPIASADGAAVVQGFQIALEALAVELADWLAGL